MSFSSITPLPMTHPAAQDLLARHRRCVLMRAASGLLIGVVMAWAAWPLAGQEVPPVAAAGAHPPVVASAPASAGASPSPAISLASRWMPLATTKPAQAVAPQPPMALLALIPGEPAGAWITTPDGGTLRIAPGQVIGGWTIHTITPSGLSLIAPDGQRVTLPIDAAQPALEPAPSMGVAR